MSNYEIDKIYPLTPTQEGILFHSLLEPDSEAYFEQVSFTIQGMLSIPIMQRSFTSLVERYDVLRTVFIYTDVEQPLQIVLNQYEPEMSFEDISTYPKEEQTRHIEMVKARDLERKFDLETGPLFRMTVFKLDHNVYNVVWRFHHIIMDGWCMGILAQDLFQIYEALESNSQLRLAPVYPYSDYIRWLGEQDQQEALHYWSQYLEDYELRATVPSLGEGDDRKGFDHRKYHFKWDEDTTLRLKRLAVQHQVTLSTVFHAIWGVLLQRYNDSEDVVFGSVVSGRPPELPGIESMVGLFINTVPLRIRTDKHTSFQELLTQVNDSMLEANRYNYVSLADIQSKTVLKNQLIDHILVFENYPLDTMGGDGGSLSIIDSDMVEHTNYNLDVTVFPEEELEVLFTYNGFFYDEHFLRSLEGHLKRIVDIVLDNDGVCLRDIEIISEQEKRVILTDFNDTENEFRLDKPAHELFEEHARRHPEKTALCYQEEYLTYDQLNRKANRLARLFRQHGLEKGDFAAVMLDRSPLMVASILAIWKLGAAYIPVDPHYPQERKTGIIADSNARIVVALSGHVEDELKARYPGRFAEMDNLVLPEGEEAESNICVPVAMTELAYTLFTSGSTGKPKGVLIEHLGMLNHIWAEAHDLHLSDDIVFAQTANHCFDISVWQLFGALVLGGTTVIYPDDLILAPERFIHQVIRDRVTLLEVVPSYLSVLLDIVQARSLRFESLQHLMITGEAVTPSLAARWFELCPGIKMVNAYGPAEASDDICQYVMDRAPEVKGYVPVGKPLSNIQMYIVNKQMQLCPIGIVGEICVAGIAVGRGYLNDPEQTAKGFIEDPFASRSGVRLYRTGDLGRWLPDGNVEFIGRKDQQIKIRGFRIELGEIEHRLSEHEQIREAAVLVRGEAEKYLCAYYTSYVDLTASELKEYLIACLPDYMVPTIFVQLEDMPHNANGKINRRGLPEPVNERNEGEVVPARNDTEKALVSIWMEILEIKRVSIEDNFFTLGGHSLKATILVSRIQGELGVDVTVRDIFEYPTVALLAERIREMNGAEYDAESISPAPVHDAYPVSPAQRRIYVLHTLEESESTAYNMPFAYQVKGHFDAARFQHMVNRLIDRHEVFRTSFRFVDGELVQIIHPEAVCKLEEVEMTGAGKEHIEEQIKSFIRPFSLEETPLLRVQWLHTGQAEGVLLIDMHHIISDGLSGVILLNELERMYSDNDLPPLDIQYKDYAIWLNERLGGEEMKRHESYWLEHFRGELPLLNLPLDYRRPAVQSFNGKTLHISLSPELAVSLQKLSRDMGVTLFSVMLGAYCTLLSKYSGQEEIIVGTPAAGRNHRDVQHMLGMFINTVALRNFPKHQKTFRELVREVMDHTLSAIHHQDFPFERLVELLDLNRDTSRNPLFDTMFNLTDREKPEVSLGELRLTPYEMKNDISKFDLMLDVYADHTEISLDLQYNTDLFSELTVQQMGRHYLQLLHNLVTTPDIALANVELLGVEERREIMSWGQGQQADYDFNLSVPQRFERFANEQPDSPAVKFAGGEWSYAELNAQANRIGRYLQRHLGDLPEETIAAVMLDRSPDFIQSVLGIWKAGGAYVPIDPDYGDKRITGILKDSAARVLITRSEYIRDGLEEQYKGAIICLDRVLEDIETESPANIGTWQGPDSLAYVLFTSGSTGKPKGVMIEHRGLLNHILAEADALNLDHRLVFAQNANICFDISVWQCFGALALGGTTAMYPQDLVLEAERFLEAITADHVTLLEVVPSYLTVMLDVLEQKGMKLDSLGHLMLTGETIKPDLARRWLNLYPEIPIVNAYGPAEAADDISQLVIRDLPQEAYFVPIGKPLANLNLYVVDNQMNLCPAGVYGEICVSGAGVGRGYIHDPKRTDQSFGKDPFAPYIPESGKGLRLYKTGDLGRWGHDGNLEFLGRKDFQVKIRGYRIELEEIEVCIMQSPHIKQAVVLAREDDTGSKYLCAYLVLEPSVQGSEEMCLFEVKDELAATLPVYMIPAHFIILEEMPLLISGKINRDALPAPDRSAASDENYTEPRNEVEQILATIWEEVLSVGRIGIDHNFFELGGDSIRAIQISSKLSNQGYKLKMKDLFQNPEIRKLSKYVQADHREIDQGPVEGLVKLTPIQKWFFECGFSPANHWNQAVVLHKREGFNEVLLKEVFTGLIRHHDALRMVFKYDEGLWMQYNRGENIREEHSWFELIIKTVADGHDGRMEMSRVIDELHGSLDLENGPLVKAGLFKTSQGDHLAIIIHHLIIDGISWRILFEDLTLAYHQAEQGKPIVLPSKTDSFQTWADRLTEYASSEMLQKEKSYWQQLESQHIKVLPKSSLFEGKARVSDNMEYTFKLAAAETGQLLGKVHKAYNTEINDILLAALGRAVREWTSEDNVLICLEGHGREDIIKNVNISRTVGWFTSIYPVVLNIPGSADISYHIKSVKENLRRIPNKGIGYGILKYLGSNRREEELQFRLEPEIKFNYLGQFDNDVNTEVFGASDVPYGQTVSPEAEREVALNITGLVEDGCLTMSIEYNLAEYTGAEISLLGERFKTQLMEIIKHCIEKETQELTPSDVGGDDLSIEELEAIMDFYNQ
ncbi:Plipastatin synthase subunit B [Paenibacillus sp. JJ-100]|uniref:non-ribosomal peptide synthetase n=1 Tax=Paenibacillus sp. JJ-100 TaxID=2974896 RepID=UPI0022FF5050|nr:non-ribosomal peptide synthetase [Paenibacillus sp. JJ-100]CAI6068591.1 Plipastatin synthase subunit B [Paenibacillus sp. JJ-100]